MDDKPYSQACENNKVFILQALKIHFEKCTKVLEIGSGSGQHAVYFAPNLPDINWYCSDQVEYHPGINAWIDECPSSNLHRPVELVFPNAILPSVVFDGVFTANTAHIMLKDQVKSMMRSIEKHLPASGTFCQYGPFKIDNKFTSDSNAEFHEKLIESGRGGYRDIDELQSWAPALTLVEIKPMPANNLLLVWQK